MIRKNKFESKRDETWSRRKLQKKICHNNSYKDEKKLFYIEKIKR